MTDSLVLEVSAESSDPLVQYFFVSKQEVGKPKFLSFVRDSVYVALDEYLELNNDEIVPNRAYFRSNAEIIFRQNSDSSIENFADEVAISVMSLQIPEGFVYGADFRVDDIGVFQ
jgi:hypothetical protein